MELQEQRAAFVREGLNVAAVSYDSIAILRDFAGRKNITYPLLSDPDSKMIRDFGILNDSVPKGTPFYGVPYPGTYIVNPRGIVTKKFFENDYRERYSSGTILWQTSPEAVREGWQEAATDHLKLRWRASDPKARGGNVTELRLEVTLKPKMHVYAPGVQSGYIPVQWTVPPTEAGKVGDATWPKAKILDLKAIKEKAPVYEKQFTVERDVTFAQQKPLQAIAKDGKVTIESTFKYQACDDKVCYPPVTMPLKWEFTFEPHDSTRVPVELRRK